MTIPFIKAHGAGNDFLLTWTQDAPQANLPELARAICDRHTGMGADGWMLVDSESIHLFNADGSEPELSGNGTRCAAAVLIDSGASGPELTLLTGAGPRRLRLIERDAHRFLFEMDMGSPSYQPDQLHHKLPLSTGPLEVTLVNVGNPQCVVFMAEFPPDWVRIAAEIEAHSYFPQRSNVSFVQRLGEHAIRVRFFERGVGPTQSSGTGATGAAVASVLLGLAKSPVRVETVAGDLQMRWDDSVYLTGPAEIVGRGEYYWDSQARVS